MSDREASAETPDEEADDEEWEFTLEDIEEREQEAEAAAEDTREPEPIEAGAPTFEGVAFVLLGVVFTIYILSRLVVG